MKRAIEISLAPGQKGMPPEENPGGNKMETQKMKDQFKRNPQEEKNMICPHCKNIVLEEVKSNPPGALRCPNCEKGYMPNPKKWHLPAAAQPSKMHYHGKGHEHRHAGLAHENPYDPFAKDNPDAGLARERKYTSHQDWEQAYRKKRVSKVRYYKKGQKPSALAVGVPAFAKAAENPSTRSATGGRHYTPAEVKAIMSTAQFRQWKSARGGPEPGHGWFHAFMTDVGKRAQLKGEKKWPAETMFSDRQGFEHPQMKKTYHKIGEFAKRKKNPDEPDIPAEVLNPEEVPHELHIYQAHRTIVSNPPDCPHTDYQEFYKDRPGKFFTDALRDRIVLGWCRACGAIRLGYSDFDAKERWLHPKVETPVPAPVTANPPAEPPKVDTPKPAEPAKVEPAANPPVVKEKKNEPPVSSVQEHPSGTA